MGQISNIPESLRKFVRNVGEPVSSADVDIYDRVQGIHDRSHWRRTIVAAWREQQKQDRVIRQKYAYWLLGGMGLQVVAINTICILMGCGVLTFAPWTAKTFVMAVFAEIVALVLIIVKYLFRPTDKSILHLSDHLAQENQHGD